jgi:predicted Rossmann-fold nucleotide-binding protein
MTLVQTGKIDAIPMVFYGSEYWKGLIDWIKNTMLEKAGNINAKDLDLFHITDDVDEVVRIIESHYEDKKLMPNF